MNVTQRTCETLRGEQLNYSQISRYQTHRYINKIEPCISSRIQQSWAQITRGRAVIYLRGFSNRGLKLPKDVRRYIFEDSAIVGSNHQRTRDLYVWNSSKRNKIKLNEVLAKVRNHYVYEIQRVNVSRFLQVTGRIIWRLHLVNKVR